MLDSCASWPTAMHEFTICQLHLAAYIKANGAEFVGYKNREFTFRSEKPLQEWRTLHMDSCCRLVDIHLVELRKYLKQ